MQETVLENSLEKEQEQGFHVPFLHRISVMHSNITYMYLYTACFEIGRSTVCDKTFDVQYISRICNNMFEFIYTAATA